MRDVDYVKLSEQYGGFLIAIGGVSITVFSIVSSFGGGVDFSVEGAISSFVGVSLIVATVSCFIGAHMMAETAAFNNYFKEKLANENKEMLSGGKVVQVEPSELPAIDGLTFGKRLFLLASTNIFIAVNLVLFAIVMLPAAKGGSLGGLWIYFFIFASVGGGALYWMVLAAKHRLPVDDSRCAKKILKFVSDNRFAKKFLRPVDDEFAKKFLRFANDNLCAIIIAATAGLAWGLFLWFISVSRHGLLLLTFAPIVGFTVATLIFFARIFKGSKKDPEEGNNKGPHLKVRLLDTGFFGSAVTVSYMSLVIAGIRIIMFGG